MLIALHAGGAEPGRPPAADARPGVGFGCDWPAVHADDAHQDHGRLSAAGAGVGDAAAALGTTSDKTRSGVACCALAAAGAFAATFGLWMALVVRLGIAAPTSNTSSSSTTTTSPRQFYWPLLSLWWSFHGGLWVDHILIPLAGCWPICWLARWRALPGWRQAPGAAGCCWTRSFGASVLAVAGLHPVHDLPGPSAAPLLCGGGLLLLLRGGAGSCGSAGRSGAGRASWAGPCWRWPLLAAVVNGAWTLSYAAHPEYTFVAAAQQSDSIY